MLRLLLAWLQDKLLMVSRWLQVTGCFSRIRPLLLRMAFISLLRLVLVCAPLTGLLVRMWLALPFGCIAVLPMQTPCGLSTLSLPLLAPMTPTSSSMNGMGAEHG